eukprot:g2296.t1
MPIRIKSMTKTAVRIVPSAGKKCDALASSAKQSKEEKKKKRKTRKSTKIPLPKLGLRDDTQSCSIVAPPPQRRILNTSNIFVKEPSADLCKAVLPDYERLNQKPQVLVCDRSPTFRLMLGHWISVVRRIPFDNIHQTSSINNVESKILEMDIDLLVVDVREEKIRSTVRRIFNNAPKIPTPCHVDNHTRRLTIAGVSSTYHVFGDLPDFLDYRILINKPLKFQIQKMLEVQMDRGILVLNCLRAQSLGSPRVLKITNNFVVAPRWKFKRHVALVVGTHGGTVTANATRGDVPLDSSSFSFSTPTKPFLPITPPTVGSLAGGRAAQLAAKREKEQEEYAKKRKMIEKKNDRVDVKRIDSKFSRKTTTGEAAFKAQTVGMVTLEEYRKAKQGLLDAAAAEAAEQANAKRRRLKKKRKKKSKKRKAGDADVRSAKRFGKDPSIETAFLPDVHRDKEKEMLRQKYTEEWHSAQERLKKEKLEVTYSYWDGSGHRRQIVVEKGTTVGKFLEKVRVALLKEFKELRSVSAANLLYVKEDLIIPHHFSFYDLIVTKARGKSGPLFHFDVHDDVRLVNDARVEKDESHPGKIVERRWFDRNKHIFPASRWEVYDPSVARKKYTIHGNEVRGRGGTTATGGVAPNGSDAASTESSAMAGIWSVGANL